MTIPEIQKQILADKAVDLTSQLGSIIAKLNDRDCTVSLEVWFNRGTESISLHELNGELELRAGVYVSLTSK